VRLLVRSPIVLHLSDPRARLLFLILHRLARGCLYSYFVWCAYVYPLSAARAFRPTILAIASLLDLPLALAALVLPSSLAPINMLFLDLTRNWTPPPSLRTHLLAGSVIWALLLSLREPAFRAIKSGRILRFLLQPLLWVTLAPATALLLMRDWSHGRLSDRV
jgi:hypothetical protein